MKFGFLHIGKTGGSSVRQLITALAAAGSCTLDHYGHNFTLDRILADRDVRVSFVVRDPVERFVSSFNSRLRCGRPTYSFPWKDAEAISFSFFKSANELAEGLDCDDERLISAAQFAMSAITHIRRNYAYHLHSVEFLKEHQERIYFVCDIADLDDNIVHLLQPLGVSDDLIKNTYKQINVAPSTSGTKTTSLSDKAINNLKKVWAADIAIYEYCRKELCRIPARAQCLDRAVSQQPSLTGGSEASDA